jgi:hypothetical protein
MNIGAFIKLPLAQVMGGVLVTSLLTNIFLFWNGQKQVEKKIECVQAVQTVNRIATEKKVVIEKRQDNVSKDTQVRVTAQLDAIRHSLQNRNDSRKPDLSGPAGTPVSPNGDSNPSAILLPEDELICSVNTTLAATWPIWYAEQVRIREEENAGDNPESSSVPSQ